MSMRAFLAVDFGSELKSQIAGLQSELRKYALSGRWKFVDNFHLTLKFLDEITEKQASEIGGVMKDICGKCGPFRLHIGKLGFFPGRGNIRVLWLGMDGELDRLGALRQNIEKGLQPLGFAMDPKPFRPHVTIAQEVNFSIGFDELAKSVDLESFPSILADRVILFRSEQLSGKRLYTPIGEYFMPLIRQDR